MSETFRLSEFGPTADGVTDDTSAFERCFAAAAAAGGGVIKLEPGDYFLAGTKSVTIPSGTTVLAHGARFRLPEFLGDQARAVLFEGQDVVDFAWHGGAFFGHCFDHRRPPNTWAPNANTRMLRISTSRGGRTANLRFQDIDAERIAGAVVNVEGVSGESEAEVDTFATDVAVHNCRFVDCGKFMWDYGLLWQILVWPEDYTPADLALAQQYSRPELIRGPVHLDDGDDRVRFDNRHDPLAVGNGDQTVCFFGDRLPTNLGRGRQYWMVDAGTDHIRVAASPGGAPLRFAGAGGPEARLLSQLPLAYWHLFAPLGAGPGKGSLDLVACRGTNVTGNRLSALGDTMHIQRCHNNVFANNQILGSRMGAFFLAEYCRNSTVTGNTVDGTNGSRVMSVEKSNVDVTIVGNTFRNGGRGSWINQPQGIVMQGNIFINNTTKGEADPWRGRKGFETGDYVHWPELYFTLHQPDGSYGPVILRDNLFVTGPECREAVSFSRNGHDLLIDGNIFTGAVRTLRIEPGCSNVHIGVNPNLEVC